MKIDDNSPDTLMLIFFACKDGNRVRSGFFMRKGIRYEWAWPLKFVLQVFDLLIHLVLRRVPSRA